MGILLGIHPMGERQPHHINDHCRQWLKRTGKQARRGGRHDCRNVMKALANTSVSTSNGSPRYIIRQRRWKSLRGSSEPSSPVKRRCRHRFADQCNAGIIDERTASKSQP
jgi:hypothetical protein